jgi:hypothetical protein
MQHLIPRPPGIAFCTFTKASDASERTHLSAVSSPWGKDDLSSDEDFFLQPRGELSIKDRYTACVHLPFAGTYSHPLVSETVSKRFLGSVLWIFFPVSKPAAQGSRDLLS